MIHSIHSNITSAPTQLTIRNIEEDKKYKLIYKIEDNKRINLKTNEYVSDGSKIISDLKFIMSYFVHIYDGPSDSFMFNLRHYVSEIVRVHSSIKILGRGPKAMKKLKKSSTNLKSILSNLKDPNNFEFLKSCYGAYMYFGIEFEKEKDFNCIIYTDEQSRTKEEVDRLIEEDNFTDEFKRGNDLSDDELREILLEGLVRREYVQINLDQKKTLH